MFSLFLLSCKIKAGDGVHHKCYSKLMTPTSSRTMLLVGAFVFKNVKKSFIQYVKYLYYLLAQKII